MDEALGTKVKVLAQFTAQGGSWTYEQMASIGWEQKVRGAQMALGQLSAAANLVLLEFLCLVL